MNNENSIYRKWSVQVNDLVKVYDNGSEKLTVLHNLHFNLSQGESAVIMGKSGSGKSTFLHILGGLDSTTSGSVVVAGSSLHTLSAGELAVYRKENLGFIFQMHFLLEDFTAYDNLFVTALVQGMAKSQAAKRAKEKLALVGLSDRTNHFPGQLSGGERQRVAIARALMNDPKLILADEPTGNLDEENAETVENLLFNLVKEQNISMIFVTHDAGVRKYADYNYQLKKGRLVAYDESI